MSCKKFNSMIFLSAITGSCSKKKRFSINWAFITNIEYFIVLNYILNTAWINKSLRYKLSKNLQLMNDNWTNSFVSVVTNGVFKNFPLKFCYLTRLRGHANRRAYPISIIFRCYSHKKWGKWKIHKVVTFISLNDSLLSDVIVLFHL